MTLISMTDFVLDKQRFKEDSDTAIFKITNYANFLKQPLKLEMFVPCDEDGIIIEPKKFTLDGHPIFNGGELYQQAKEKVLFEGFDSQKQGGEILVTFDKNPVWINWNNSKTIEDLIYLKPILTQNAIKQLGL